ncbi:MAG: hemolysin family protein [Leptospirales bacterium]|nr:hemolysin family protein [Leptospirales bacterium]
MTELLIYKVVIVIFVILSASFSCFETAIISSKRITIETLSKGGSRRAFWSLKILDNIDDAIGMVLICSNICTIGAAAFITYLITKIYFYNDTQLFAATVVQTIFFLIFCEITPKIISRANSEKLLLLFSLPILVLMKIFKPLISFALFFSSGITKLFKIESGEVSSIGSRDDIADIISIGKKDGVIDEEENIYLSEILSFKNAKAFEIMIPTVDIISVDINDSYKNIISVIERTRFSKLPVYRNREDNFVGYIYYRDILKNPGSKIEEIIIEPVFIPETKNILDFYNMMHRSRIPLVFVVDEYGNTTGMVTFEDIAEEIVGEIQTGDHPSEEHITKINEKKYILSGRLDIDYFQRYFKIEIQKLHFETLGGFIMSLTGDIPDKGDHVKYRDNEFVIEEVGVRTIEKVLLILPKKKK